jgi:tetratricopeptide (TPR) repeat protein
MLNKTKQMKKLIILLIILILPFLQLFPQSTKSVYSTKQLIEQRNIYLNGGTRASFGGKSRTYIKIDLPANTVKWYYSFSTSPGESGTNNLKLLAQLAAIYADPSGFTSTIAKDIEVPKGSQSIDVYLCDRPNIDKFRAKDDLYGEGYSYIMEGTVENTRQGVIEIDDKVRGVWYLGLKNPSALDGVNITIEVVAIVKEVHVVEKTENQEKAELYAKLGWQQFEAGNYEKSLEYNNKAIGLYEYGWIYANKGLVLLLLEKEDEAMDAYINAITLINNQENPAEVFSSAIDKIDKLIIDFPEIIAASDIKEIIMMELEKYNSQESNPINSAKNSLD